MKQTINHNLAGEAMKGVQLELFGYAIMVVLVIGFATMYYWVGVGAGSKYEVTIMLGWMMAGEAGYISVFTGEKRTSEHYWATYLTLDKDIQAEAEEEYVKEFPYWKHNIIRIVIWMVIHMSVAVCIDETSWWVQCLVGWGMVIYAMCYCVRKEQDIANTALKITEETRLKSLKRHNQAAEDKKNKTKKDKADRAKRLEAGKRS